MLKNKPLLDMSVDEFIKDLYEKIMIYDSFVLPDDEAYWTYSLKELGKAIQKRDEDPYEFGELHI